MPIFLYNFFILIYKLGIRLASFKSNKAKAWIVGRRDLLEKIALWRNGLAADEKIIWIHCASLGEFEQGRPLIEKLKEANNDTKIVLTFFSPSGYEIRKNYTGVDAVFYLPMDGKKNAEKFIEILQPTFVFWVKYEYWFYYLITLKQKGIPVILISAIFRRSQPFFKWYGGMWKKILHSFDKIFVQNKESLTLLQTIGLAQNANVMGDTRFDRVIDIAEKITMLPVSLQHFVSNSQVIVAGSTWEEDEIELVHYANANPHIKFIIAPHEIDDERIADVKKLFKNSVLFSTIKEQTAAQIIIIDNIGMLATLYKLATVVYIGGGFNDTGIHNILEAAVFGKPIIFGPVYEKFSEAVNLVNEGGAFSITNAIELEERLNTFLSNEMLLTKTGEICRKFVYSNRGASNKILQYVYENRLLTN